MDRRDAIIAGAGLGLGGLLAARPDQQYYPAAGGAQIPGSRTGKIRANQVIITGTGPNAGLFVYAVPPALGLGNPPVFSVVAPGVTHDPFGNAVAAVLEAGTIGTNYMQVDQAGNLILYHAGNQVIIFNPAKQAVFYYSPSAAAGNLVASQSPVGGTDSFGNAYLSGFVNYNPSLIVAIQLVTGQINFYSAASTAGPWNALGNISDGLWAEPSISGLNLQVGTPPAQVQISQNLVDIVANLQVDAGVLIQASKGSLGGLLKVVSQLAAPGNVPILLEAQGATDRFIGMDVAGDTVRRFNINASGSMLWGPGNAGQDCTLYRAGTNLLAADYCAFAASNVNPESWNAATFANGWGNALAGTGLQFKRVHAPDQCILWVGRILAPSGLSSGQAIITATPTGYHPTSIQRLLAGNVTSGGVAQFQAETNGTLTYRSGAVAGDNLDFGAHNLVSLDA